MKRHLSLLICLLGLLLLPAAAEEAPITNPEQAKTELESVLAQPEFVNATKPGLVEQLGQWLYNWLSQMDTDLRAYEFIGQLTRLSYALMWMILIISFLALGYWVFRVFKRRRWEEDDSTTTATELAADFSFSSLESHPLHSDQPPVERILQAWRRLIGKLEDTPASPDLRASTNREALATLPNLKPELERELHTLAQAYDRHVFGHAPLPEDQAKAAEAILDAAGGELTSSGKEATR